MLVRLMYVSRARDAVDAESVLEIVRQSKTNNPAQGITGVLCFSDGLFIQVLEGGRGPVNALYNRIVGDARHHDVQLLSYEEIGERRFIGWAMGQVNLSRLNPSLLLKYCETATLDPYGMSGNTVLALFSELAGSAAVVCP